MALSSTQTSAIDRSRFGDPYRTLPLAIAAVFVLMLALQTLANIDAGTDVTIRKIPEGKNIPVPSFVKDSVVWVSMTDFAEQAGFKHSESVFSKKLTFSNDKGKITFIQDNHFYTVDTAIFALPQPPTRKGSALYLPAPDLVKAFGARHPGALSWDAKASTIIINALKHTILTIASEVKQNGTVVSITLADSLMYECTYVHPTLAVNFNGGKIDPKAIRRSLRAGVIDSAFTLQYDGSAQVSFILNQGIEKPHVDYNDANRTLMVALKPKIEQKKAAAPPAPLDVSLIRTIVIDPGHGGKDPGAVGPTGVFEKDVALAIALELKKLLEKAGLKVHMTREKDVFIPLRDRTKFANEKKADLFVSIHANAIPGDKKKRDATKGYKMYFLSQAKNDEDKMAAMRENAAIELEDKESRKNYDALQDMLTSLMGTEYQRESQELCIIMEQTFGANQKQIPRSQLGVGQAPFWVLNGAYMPAVLVETGFISNAGEETLLSDKRMQFQLAAALSESVIKFKQLFEMGQ